MHSTFFAGAGQCRLFLPQIWPVPTFFCHRSGRCRPFCHRSGQDRPILAQIWPKLTFFASQIWPGPTFFATDLARTDLFLRYRSVQDRHFLAQICPGQTFFCPRSGQDQPCLSQIWPGSTLFVPDLARPGTFQKRLKDSSSRIFVMDR